MAKSKRAVAIFVCLALVLLCFGFTAFSVNKKLVKAEESPVKANIINEFMIGSWVSYYDTNLTSYANQTEDLGKSGINWIVAPHENSGVTAGEPPRPPSAWDWDTTDKLYKQNNMKYLMHGKTPEEALQLAQGKEACNAYYVADEPSQGQFEKTKTNFMKFYDNDTTRIPFVNMFPNYAGASNLGGSYEDYIRNWVKTIGKDKLEYLVFDHYPFTASEPIRSSYFSDVETIRKVAYENDRIKTGGFTQMGSWNGMRRPTVDEARWSVNSLLAYGMKDINHFCWVAPKYKAPPSGEGMQDFVLTSEGEKTDLYQPMQKVNWQTRQLGTKLMQIDCAHAYHTGLSIPTGVEKLPANYFIKPSQTQNEFIISVFNSKDDSEKYVMLFNKSLDTAVTQSFEIDLSSGITGLTYYETSSFESLPDPTKPLPQLNQVAVATDSGSISVALKAGEAKLYKINGNVQLPEQLKAPRSNLKNGIAVGEQMVELDTADRGAEIYYTTDGSFPSKMSTKYVAPFKIGATGANSNHAVRAVSVRGDEISPALELNIVIRDASINIAKGKPATLSVEGESFNGVGSPISVVNDGEVNFWSCYGSKEGENGYITIDFLEARFIDSVAISLWNDWEFKDVVVQLCANQDFSSGVTTVYNNDNDNTLGLGSGVTQVYKENPSGGHSYNFDAVNARYLRIYNTAVNSHRTIFTEISAYTAYSGGDNTQVLTKEPAQKWEATGGGDWSYSNGTIIQSGQTNKDDWWRQYSFNDKKYKNFLLEGTFKFTNAEAGSWGFIGFSMYKPKASNNLGDVEQGFYACIEPRGRALLYAGDGNHELGALDANVAGFSVGAKFTLRVLSVNDTVMMSVNNIPVMYEVNSKFNRQAGYIGIHAGLHSMEVSNIMITPATLDDIPKQATLLESKQEVKIAVDRFTMTSDVTKKLPKTVNIIDSNFAEHAVDINWTSDNYDRKKTGFFKFIGAPKSLPSGVANVYNIHIEARVFVKPVVIKIELAELVDKARALKSFEYTPDSFLELEIKLKAAEAILQDEFLVQSDVGVGYWQLEGKMNELVSIANTQPLQLVLDDCKNIVKGTYSDITWDNFVKARDQAELVIKKLNHTGEQINQAATNLTNAKELLSDTTILKPAVIEKKGCGAMVDTSLVFSLVFISILTFLAMFLIVKKRSNT